MRTFSKISGLAGLRIGYCLADPQIIDYFNRVRQPFNTSLLAQAAALAALQDAEFRDRHCQLVRAERERYYQAFTRLGLFYVPSHANFVLVKLGARAPEIVRGLLRQGIIVRGMQAYSLPEYIRVSIGTAEENLRFLQALTKIMGKIPD
jgi:histidinol-phosphate aminotransferase